MRLLAALALAVFVLTGCAPVEINFGMPFVDTARIR